MYDVLHGQMQHPVIDGEVEDVETPVQKGLDASKEGRQSLDVVVAGPVVGDIHESGKAIVCSMLSSGGGFTVIDIGCDSPVCG